MSLRDPSHDFFCSCLASFPINLVELLALDWPFYNSKSSKPKGSVNLFRKRVLVTLRALIKAPYLAQLLSPLLATLLLKILLLAAKTSLLAQPPLKALTPLLCHVLPCPLLLRRSFLLCLLWPNIQRIISRRSSGLFWILDLLHLFWLPLLPALRTIKAHISGFWKHDFPTCIGVKSTWSIIISSSNATTTLSPPLPRGQTKFRLRLSC